MSNERLLSICTAALCAAGIAAAPAASAHNDQQARGKHGQKHQNRHHGGRIAKDSDRDGLSDRAEHRAGTNRYKADTDGDGIKDRDEHAGTIKSFENGVLTLALFDGSTLSGKVNPGTRIECDSSPRGVAARNGADDASQGNIADDRGGDRGKSGSDDGARHDAGDDSSSATPSGRGTDDGPNHDLNDDHGNHDTGNHHSSGNDDNGNGNGNGNDDRGQDCGPKALVAGAKVDEAELVAAKGVRVFKKVELAR
jgi:hypothetical protein